MTRVRRDDAYFPRDPGHLANPLSSRHAFRAQAGTPDDHRARPTPTPSVARSPTRAEITAHRHTRRVISVITGLLGARA
jgi:hypothetical protein